MLIVGRPKEEIDERKRVIRADFHRKYNSGELCKELYDKQNGLCFLCEKPVQGPDTIFMAPDHANSVFGYAESNFSIEEATEQANDRKNLIGLCVSCNLRKNSTDFEEFVERVKSGAVSLDSAPYLTQTDIEDLKRKKSETARKGGLIGGRKGGLITGRKCAENKIGVCGQTPEKMSENGRKAGSKNAENKVGIHGMTFKQRSEAGHKGGSKTRENRTGIYSRTLEQMSEDGRKAGRISNRKNFENKTGIYSLSLEQRREIYESSLGKMTSEEKFENGRKGGRKSALINNHSRWHVKRRLISPNCILCTRESQVFSRLQGEN